MPLIPSRSRAPEDLLMFRAEYLALAQQDNERITRYHQYRSEGNNVRDPNLGVYTSDLWDYGRRPSNDGTPRRHRIPLPLAKAMTVKHSYRISGSLPDIIVDERDDSAAERFRSDSMEKIAWAIMRASRVETTFSSAAWNGSELGSGCLDLWWNYKKNMPVFRSVDPAGIHVVPGVDDPHEFRTLYRVWEAPVHSVQAEYRDKMFRGQPIDVRNIQGNRMKGSIETVKIVQRCDREKLVRFALSGENGLVGLSEFTHNYGFVPYVVLPNIGPYDDIWGWADYEFVRGVAQYITMLFSREADVLKAVAAGAYQEDGTGVSAATIAKIIRDGGVISKKRDTRIEPIQAADMPSFATDHGERAMDMLKMLGFSPDAAWGLPGSGSGTDRGLQLQPLLEYTAMKQLNWQTGLGRLFSMAYQMIEQKMIGQSTYRGAKPGVGGRSTPLSFTFGPDTPPEELTTVADDGFPEITEVPKTPRELFDGDYEVRFVWRNRVDPEDPQYVMSELNKFQQGAQSLETTLENLGVQAPEDEMRRIEKESKRFPWVNQGLVSLLMAQMRGNAQGTGGGAPAGDALSGAAETFGSAGGGGASGALNTDLGADALGPDSVGVPYGGA